MELASLNASERLSGRSEGLPVRRTVYAGPEQFGLTEGPPPVAMPYEIGPVSEPPALVSPPSYSFRIRLDRTEDREVFPSDAAMRFDLRLYSHEEMDHIHRATAERELPGASPIPLED